MVRLSLFVFFVVTILVALFFFLKPNKPKQVSSLFVSNKPSFSLKLPDGWYRDLDVKGNKKLLSFSPDKTTVISAGVSPTVLSLDGEVAKAQKDIGSLSVNHKFIIDKPLSVKGYPAHLFEYNTNKDGLLLHHTDIITVKDGYFIDIAAYTQEQNWPKTVDLIEKSFNTISFNPK